MKETISKMEQFFADEMATTLRKMANKLNKTPWDATKENKERSSLINRVGEIDAELTTIKDSLEEFYKYLNTGS
jgi:hypothetical protein